MRRIVRRYLPVVPIAMLLLDVGPAHAEETAEWRDWPLGDRSGLIIGGFFANLETTVRVDGSDGVLGTEISFERHLGLDDTKTRPVAQAYWRFREHHRLNFMYLNLDRSGDSVSSVDIRFGDQIFQANLPIQAYFDVEIYNLGYSYSILFDEKKDWSVGFALSFQDLGVGLQGTVVGQPLEISESDSVLAPLPTFTTRFSYALTPEWILDAGAGYFTIGADIGEGRLDGTIVNVSVGLRWKPIERLSLSLVYKVYDVDVDVEGSRWNWDVDYHYDGPGIFIGTHF